MAAAWKPEILVAIREVATLSTFYGNASHWRFKSVNYMSPYNSSHNSPDSPPSNAILGPYGLLGQVCRSRKKSDIANRFVCEFGVPVGCSLWAAATLGSIIHIMLKAPRVNMRMVHAEWVIACMTSKKFIREWSLVGHGPCESTGVAYSGFGAGVKRGIPFRRSSGPRPAFIWPSLINKSPKSDSGRDSSEDTVASHPTKSLPDWPVLTRYYSSLKRFLALRANYGWSRYFGAWHIPNNSTVKI